MYSVDANDKSIKIQSFLRGSWINYQHLPPTTDKIKIIPFLQQINSWRFMKIYTILIININADGSTANNGVFMVLLQLQQDRKLTHQSSQAKSSWQNLLCLTSHQTAAFNRHITMPTHGMSGCLTCCSIISSCQPAPLPRLYTTSGYKFGNMCYISQDISS